MVDEVKKEKEQVDKVCVITGHGFIDLKTVEFPKRWWNPRHRYIIDMLGEGDISGEDISEIVGDNLGN